VKFGVSHSADQEFMDALIELHSARWKKIGESGMITANHSEAFLHEVANLLAARGALRIFTVRFSNRIAAILLALCSQTTIFSYLSAFDPQHENFGFGRELLVQAFRYAHEAGYRSWNFLRGNEAYKFSWGARLLPKFRVVISR
jgi:CelD/BcsL family acetyltransferase involved in cellulose biosynthesis